MRVRTLLVYSLLIFASCSPDPDPPTGSNNDTGTSMMDQGATDGGSNGGTDATSPDMGTSTVDMASPDGGVADMDNPDAGSPNIDETSRSGTRLLRRYLDARDGATMFVGMYDSQLEISCEFREAPDGATRCLPEGEFLSELYFTDAACTDPVHQVSESYCSEQWSRDRFTGKIYRATETPPVFTNNRKYVRGSDGVCYEGFVGADETHFVAELVPAAEFVEGTRDDQALSGDMVARYLDGEDGSRVLYQVLHANRGYECDFEETGHCLPDFDVVRRDSTQYTDASCTDAVYGYFGEERPPMIAIPANSGDLCSDYDYFETGTEVVSNDLYYLNRDTGDCLPSTPSGLYTYYRIGAPIVVSSFPQATVEREGTGDLLARRYRDQDGAPLGPTHEFYDSTTDEPCKPFETETGEVVCVANNFGSVDDRFFLDSACAVPYSFGLKICDPSTPAMLVAASSRNCILPDRFKAIDVFATDAPAGRDYYGETFGGDCEARTFSEYYSTWETGPSILDALPTLELKREE